MSCGCCPPSTGAAESEQSVDNGPTVNTSTGAAPDVALLSANAGIANTNAVKGIAAAARNARIMI